MKVECQCSTVSFPTPAEKPIDLYCCHCTECQKQSASAFGCSAIFPADGLFPLSDDLKSKLTIWTRPAKNGNTMDCYFCNVCGSRVFHRIRNQDGTERPTVSIKGGLVEGLDLANAKHIWTSRAVFPIPAGAQSWEESPPASPKKDDK